MKAILLVVVALIALFGSVTSTEVPIDANIFTEAGTLVEVTDMTPTWGSIYGNELIVITGCHFSTYSEVTCMFDQWGSLNAQIISDTEIHCWTPTNVEFRTVPKTTDLYLLFDGTRARSEVGEFHWGPYIESVSPTQDYVAGGSTLTIDGFGFGDYSSVKVYLDDAECTGASIGSTRITCKIPEGTFNQNAIIDVYFDDNQYYFLHSYWSLHYGPILEEINPTCGRVHGGDTITFTGSLFDDPTLASPRVEMYLTDLDSWVLLSASRSGNQITVTTPVGAVFDENAPVELFGNPVTTSRRAEYSKVPGTASFHFGPMVYSVTPTVGYVLSDSVTIVGCALQNYTVDDITVNIGSENDICDVTSVTNNNDGTGKVVCTTGAHACSLQQREVTIDVPYESGTVTVPNAIEGEAFYFWWGPWVDDESLTPTRGAIAGNDQVTLTGVKMARGSSTQFTDPQCDWDLDQGGASSQTDASVNNAQTVLTCTNPTHVFHGIGSVNVLFGDECTVLTPSRQDYVYGPFCDSISPTFGYIGGGTQVTLSGRGFTDKDWTNRKMQVRFCTRYESEDCMWEWNAVAQNSKPSTEQLVATTPNFGLAPRNDIGGNRVFGEEATVLVYFGVEGGSLPTNETDFDICEDKFRWGPIVEDINPKKGPMGPRDVESPGTSVTITGAGFNDPYVKENIRVSFGDLHGFNAQTNTDSQIVVQTLWGGESNTNHDVFVYFDTCNTTVSEDVWTWGPVITEVTPTYGYNMGADNDRTTVVTIYGERFEDETWCTEINTDTNTWACDVECYIDQTHSGAARPVEDEDGTIHFECTVPDRPFGTRAEVELRFGFNPYGEDYDNDCVSNEYNYNQRVICDDELDIYYRPEITEIEPTIGEVYGGETITIRGYGLGNWDNIRCFVGEYEGTVLNKASLIAENAEIDQEVECQAPTRRYDWGEDAVVSVFLGVSSIVTVDDQVEWHEKVWAEELFHFGPYCSDEVESGHGPNPSVGFIFPESSDQVVVRGIFHPNDEYYTDSTPIVQWVSPSGSVVNVTRVNDDESAIIVEDIPRATDCMQVDTVRIYWENTQQMITCGTYRRYPVVDDEPEPELGWLGTRVTVSGVGFTDPEIYTADDNIKVTINNKEGYNYDITDTSVEFAAPANPWNTWQTVKISWASTQASSTNESCSYTLQDQFHYGPIIEAVNPTYGWVEGDRPYTVIGRGFTCCGIEDITCRMSKTDDADGAISVTEATWTTVPCTSFVRDSLNANNFELDVVIGLKFNQSSTTVLDTDDNGDDVVYHYGPFFDYVTPTHGTIEGDFLITIVGAGFDDPFFLQDSINCVFSIDDEETPQEAVSPNAVVCRTPEHMRECYDADTVQLRIPLDTTSSSNVTTRPLDSAANIDAFTHIYGPMIVSIEPTWGYLPGGEEVTITFFPDLSDFPGADFRVLFDHVEIQNLDVEYNYGDLTNSDTVLVVTSPAGAFLQSGPISVILDFKNDAETTLVDSWHWHPFVTGVSQSWSIEDGGDVVVVYGGGFCNYDTVLCSYGGLDGAQSDIAHDDRLVCHTPYHASGPASVGVTVTFCDDQDVGYHTIVDGGARDVDGQDDDRVTDCDCLYMGTTDTVSVGTHKFVGISSIEPTSGPYVGGTTVTVSGLGFSMMSRVECVFGDLPAVDVTANTTSDGQVDCVSPDAADPKVVPFRLRLTYTLDDGNSYTIYLPALSERPLFYEYGRPYITDISPDNQDLDDETTVTLTGRYFNGGDVADIKCHFIFADGSEDVFAAVSKTDTEVVCGPVSNFPDVETFTVAAVTVSFEDSRQSNMVSYQYTQNPTANKISPSTGGKYGGTTVSISGANLHGGVSYLCKFGNIIVGPATLTNQTITCKTPATDIDEDSLPEQVSVAFSIDGGLTFVPVTGEEFEYQDDGSFNDDGGNGSSASSASSVVYSAALLIAALLAVAF